MEVILFIKRWVEGPWTFCHGFCLQTQSIVALLCLMHAPWALALYSVGSFKNMVFLRHSFRQAAHHPPHGLFVTTAGLNSW